MLYPLHYSVSVVGRTPLDDSSYVQDLYVQYIQYIEWKKLCEPQQDVVYSRKSIEVEGPLTLSITLPCWTSGTALGACVV
ncbi:hypothetical protein CYMTET_25927 [Cymbomonas tetramitiformis]|uniref:Uncharacterized protein n=1 Tax=Cymbomonas tetramitiformis TaxID=36881 RepID=A0AAE0KYR4_9CHLO|nr:hypothetical protein CYMTET_25927 [Cymbomonas tetramitiformis]